MQPDILTIMSHNICETQTIGATLGHLFQAGDVICLQGNLGSGKTCLTQGISRGMGLSDTINSPTFVLIREHGTGATTLRLNHVDLYRLENATDAFALGLLDYMDGDGVTVIEWADRASELMPGDSLWISITIVKDTQRSLVLKASGTRFLGLLRTLRQELPTEILMPEPVEA